MLLNRAKAKIRKSKPKIVLTVTKIQTRRIGVVICHAPCKRRLAFARRVWSGSTMINREVRLGVSASSSALSIKTWASPVVSELDACACAKIRIIKAHSITEGDLIAGCQIRWNRIGCQGRLGRAWNTALSLPKSGQ